MKWLLIENKGLLEKESLYLMGASTKRNNENMIGRFGSGNKYAIAVLLRLGIPFHIFSGHTEEILVTTRQVDLRGVIFDIIQVDGQDTSLTIQMGPQWEPWFAIREIYSNAIDEGEVRVIETEDMNASVGHTRFYIGITEQVQRILDNWNTYFSFDRTDVLFETPYGILKVYPNLDSNEKLMIYRKGILVSDTETYSLYSYDMANIAIDESRIAREIYPLKEQAAAAWLQCNKPTLIRSMLIRMHERITQKKDLEYMENTLQYNWYDHYMNKEAWKEAIEDRLIICERTCGRFMDEQRLNSLILPYSLCVAIAKGLPTVPVYGVDEGNAVSYKLMVVDTKMEFKLKRVLADLAELQIAIAHDIKIVEFLSKSKQGQAQHGIILISGELVSNGSVREIALVLIEEEVHITRGYEDCSRDMQNYLFEQWINEREARLGKYLI
jgi:hypothetical protein